MRSLRSRLFLAILGVVLLAVGASLTLGAVLTKDAVRDTIRNDVERQAEAVATQIPRLQAGRQGLPSPPGGLPLPPGGPLRPAPGVPPGALPEGAVEAERGGGGEGIPAGGGEAPSGVPAPPPGERPLQVLSPSAARRILPPSAAEELRRTGAADGVADFDGRSSIFAARRARGRVVLVTRPDVVSGDDFSRYLSALLIASGAAALLAAAAAALLSRRLTQPLRRLASAAGEVAAGRHPEPVPPEGTEELDDLAAAFNEMSEQLSLARDAERAVLLSVSHDLRTPLSSIRGYAEGIEDGTVEPREAAGIVARESARLERLVGDLMALARLQQGALEVRREPVDLAAVAREVEERLRPRALEAGVTIEVEGASALVTADYGRTLQVISNLVENAIRLSPSGGAVRVEATAGAVSVSDNGLGLPEEEIPRAFERFHLRATAGRGSPDGAGLGLAIVRELTEAMGGTASVENLPSQGARFTVRLPD